MQKAIGQLAGHTGPSTGLLAVATLDRLGASLPGADSEAIVHWQHKDLAIANLPFVAGFRRDDDRIDCRFDKIVIHRDLQLDFAKQI